MKLHHLFVTDALRSKYRAKYKKEAKVYIWKE